MTNGRSPNRLSGSRGGSGRRRGGGRVSGGSSGGLLGRGAGGWSARRGHWIFSWLSLTWATLANGGASRRDTASIGLKPVTPRTGTTVSSVVAAFETIVPPTAVLVPPFSASGPIMMVAIRHSTQGKPQPSAQQASDGRDAQSGKRVPQHAVAVRWRGFGPGRRSRHRLSLGHWRRFGVREGSGLDGIRRIDILVIGHDPIVGSGTERALRDN
jgi:hypothetical protein